MWLLIILLLATSGLVGAIRSSLVDSRRFGLVWALGLGALCFASYPLAIQTSVRRFDEALRSEAVLQAACTLITFEAIGLMLLAVTMIREHYGKPLRAVYRWARVLPAPSFLLALMLFQTYVFHLAGNRPFAHTALGFSFAVGSGSLAAWWICQRLIRRWEDLLILMLTGSFLQLVLAMFLPLVFTRLTILDNHLEVSPPASLLVLLCAVTGIALGAGLESLRSSR